MSFISSIAPNGMAGGPLPGALAQAAALASAVANSSPTARLLLPNAVVAVPLVEPRHTDQQKTPKNAAKAPPSGPSSGFAAQLLSQVPDASEQQLAALAPRVPSPPSHPDAPPPDAAPLPAALTANLPLPPKALETTPATLLKATATTATVLPFINEPRAVAPQSVATAKRPAQVTRAVAAYGRMEVNMLQGQRAPEFEAVS